MKNSTDIELILPKWIIPVDGKKTVLSDNCMIKNGQTIDKILPIEKALAQYPNAKKLELNQHVLLPGFINCHTHAAMTLLRGVADDIALKPWLEDHIWPLEAEFVNADFVKIGTRLAIAEMIQSGTTCFNDMYFFPDIVASVAESFGIRAIVGLIMLDFPTIWASGPEEYITKGLRLADELKYSTLISPSFAPHAPYTVSDQPLERIRVLADELDLPVHMHIHEILAETEQSIDQFGVRPLERLSDLGLLSPRMIAVHMTHLLSEEIQSLAELGVNIVHCPEANLKLGSGIYPLKQCHDAGINIALGTDGAASNNDLNMLGEMRSAALLAKGSSLDAETADAWQVLEMATINAAKALNIDDVCGSLEAGKSADMIAIDLSALHCQPVYNPLSQMIYSASRSDISHSWVEGKLLMENGQLTHIDTDQLLEQVHKIGQNIAKGTSD